MHGTEPSEPFAPSAALAGHLRALGPFFAVDLHPPGATPDGPWRVLGELTADPTVLASRVAEVRERLGGQRVQPRVAASVTQLGIVARLVAPVLGAAVVGARLDVDLDGTWWQPVVGGPVPLSVPDAAAGDSDPVAAVLDGPVAALVAATRVFSVADTVLWGNVASALNGAVTMIGTERPDLAAPAAALLADQLARPPLRGTATTTTDGRFRRRNCCLIYRAAPGPGAPVCGDCVLNRS